MRRECRGLSADEPATPEKPGAHRDIHPQTEGAGTYVALALGPSGHLRWAIPGAPKSLAPSRLLHVTFLIPIYATVYRFSKRKKEPSRAA